jgi:CubicO group peptidase (beta-lactamase class C family)
MRTGAMSTIALGLFLAPTLSSQMNEQKVDRLFATYDKAESPGCALGVIRDGNFVYRKAYGTASLELGVPLSPQSVFYMGSVSKQFTAASVVLAAEQGYLSLDDDIRKYIPELPDYGHIITLRQMLHHTSGFRDFLTLLYLSGRDGSGYHSENEILDLVARQQGLNNTPGDDFVYSNTNYFLPAEVVKRATKKPLAQFAAENIFQPLGMVHTRFADDHIAVIPNRVPAYDSGTDGKFLVDWSTNFDIVGSGGLMSNVDDLLLWDRNFYNNKLGRGTLLKEMETPGALNDNKQISYALGLELGMYRGLRIVEHNGALFGYRTEILRFPEQRFTVVCLCNLSSVSVGNVSRTVADVYLAEKMQAEANSLGSPVKQSFPDPTPFAGQYLDPRTHSVYSFTTSSGSLAAWGSNLRRVGPNQFKDLGTGTITFSTSESDSRVSLEMDGMTVFAGDRIRQLNLSQTALAAFAGVYNSHELDATYQLSMNNGSLMIRSGWSKPVTMVPIAEDEFSAGDLGILVFHRTSRRSVSGFKVFAGNARNISFERK